MAANLAQAGTFRLRWWRIRVANPIPITVFAGIAIVTGTLTSLGTRLPQNVPAYQDVVI